MVDVLLVVVVVVLCNIYHSKAIVMVAISSFLWIHLNPKRSPTERVFASHHPPSSGLSLS